MRAMSFCKCPAVAVFAVGLLAFGMGAYGQEFAWVPVGAVSTDGGSIVGYSGGTATCPAESTTIELMCGYEYVIEFDLRIAGWGAAAGSPTLGTYQVAVDSTQYGDLYAYSGVDHGPLDGCFQATKVCHEFDMGTMSFTPCPYVYCDVFGPGDPACPPTGCNTCMDSPYFVFTGILATKAVSTANMNYAWGATTNAGQCKTDARCSGNLKNCSDTIGSTDCPAGETCTVGLCPSYYGGTLKLVAPATAAGSYTFGFDPASSSTFMNNCGGSPINGVVLTSATVDMVSGACCVGSGPSVVCNSFVCEPDCAPPDKFFPGEVCTGDGGTFDCPSCENDAQCNDSDACTNDHCNLAIQECEYTLTYDPMTECCDTVAGAICTIDDGNVCTADSCDPSGYPCINDPAGAAGVACDDENACTHTDQCDGVNPYPLGCAGTDINSEPCVDPSECAWGPPNEGPYDCEGGFCLCSLSTPLCFFFDDDCYEEGDPVYGTVSIGVGSELITGGQFLLEYDTTCLEFVSIGVCAGSPFENEIASIVDEDTGQVFYAVTVDPFNPMAGATIGPEDLACAEFIMLDNCGPCDVCFLSVNPKNTILTNNLGYSVVLDICEGTDCSEEIWLETDIDLVVPDGAEVNSECDLPTAVVTWDPPYAEAECEVPDIECVAEHDGGVPIDHLIWYGGVFPQGTSYFSCTASIEQCDVEVTKVWTVNVSDQQALDVYVQLSPVMNPGLFSRCITFELFDDCVGDPTVYSQVLWFDGPYNFDGKARLELKVPKGQYHCITAQDLLHTLRSWDLIECVDGVYVAEFRGDPLLDGNWLIGGNLDAFAGLGGENHIDILDFGMFMAEIAAGADYPDGNTDCDTPGPHGDINADGHVDVLDYNFIMDNYLAESKNACCPDAGSSAPLTSITVKELRAMGLGHLAVADLNNDNVVDNADMAAYQQGVRPASVDRVRKDTKALGR